MASNDRYISPTGQSRKLTPKMKAYIAAYNDPLSPTFGNALQSALKAGYSKEYANNFTVKDQRNAWKDSATATDMYTEMLQKAENNLKKIVEMPESEYKGNTQVMKIWKDTNTFVSERLGKDKWSSRQELTDKGGRRLFSNAAKETAAIPLHQLFKVAE